MSLSYIQQFFFFSSFFIDFGFHNPSRIQSFLKFDTDPKLLKVIIVIFLNVKKYLQVQESSCFHHVGNHSKCIFVL